MQTIDDLAAGMEKIAIMGHVNPDGDCVGSCLGMWSYLNDNTKAQVDVYLDPFKDGLLFLAENKNINPVREDPVYDLIFVLDCAAKDRIGKGREYLEKAKKVICMDHHVSNTGFGDLFFVYPDCSSAAEAILTHMIPEKISDATAVCLYTGIVHDTGVFQYSNASPETFIRTAGLMKHGFDCAKIIQKSFYEKSYEQQKLTGLALGRAAFTKDREGIWSYLTLEETENLHASASDTDGIVEALRNTKGIDYSVFLHERKPGVYKISMRSKEKTDVSRICMKFGGGGHVRAAGCTILGESPESVFERIEKAVGEEKA